MLKKTITYEDYEGNTRTEDFYFNLSKAEVIKWLTTSGDYTLDKVLVRLSEERNGKRVMEIFEDLLHRSYGKKSLDGRRFVKNEEVWNEFYETEAYSIMFTELVSDARKASDFVNNIIPNDLAKDIARIMKENPEGIPDTIKDYAPKEVLSANIGSEAPVNPTITPPPLF